MIRYGIIAVCLIPLIFIPVSASSPQYGIALSQSCMISLKNNLPTNCPDPEEIMALFPDTTDQKKSGEFQIIDNVLQRGKPQVLNPQRLNDFNKEPTLWFDPPGDVRARIIMITIDKALPPYKTDASLKMDDYTVEFQQHRWVNNCHEAIISADNWVFLTGDTLNYMKHGCDDAFTSFDGTVELKFEKSYQDLQTSSKHKLDEMVKIAKEKYKISYIGSNEDGFNRAVIEDEDE